MTGLGRAPRAPWAGRARPLDLIHTNNSPKQATMRVLGRFEAQKQAFFMVGLVGGEPRPFGTLLEAMAERERLARTGGPVVMVRLLPRGANGSR